MCGNTCILQLHNKGLILAAPIFKHDYFNFMPNRKSKVYQCGTYRKDLNLLFYNLYTILSFHSSKNVILSRQNIFLNDSDKQSCIS